MSKCCFNLLLYWIYRSQHYLPRFTVLLNLPFNQFIQLLSLNLIKTYKKHIFKLRDTVFLFSLHTEIYDFWTTHFVVWFHLFFGFLINFVLAVCLFPKWKRRGNFKKKSLRCLLSNWGFCFTLSNFLVVRKILWFYLLWKTYHGDYTKYIWIWIKFQFLDRITKSTNFSKFWWYGTENFAIWKV